VWLNNYLYIYTIKQSKDMTNQKFISGHAYQMRFIGDSDLRPAFQCMERTAKTVTFEGRNETLKRRIKIDLDGNEYVKDGNYSMAPTINAKHRH